MSDEPDLVLLYQQTMDRIIELVSAPDVSLGTAVAACPGWSVRDVLAHMAGVAQDWAAGRRAAPPNDEQTAARCPPERAAGFRSPPRPTRSGCRL
ncbi:maleylpyruvate isomerase N-terminal domain-containing protein, partial [Mycolicibacterium mucogenicum]|uniref:maleylpyruvate isomerase N-terminal domain-containing protein n=1 Tax=Mycolicibacterium mucogenicum TaxID=56689 RepID=UPI001A96BAA3